MIWDGVGDWYGVDYSIDGDIKMYSFTFHTLKHSDQEKQIKDAIASKIKVDPDRINLYHAIRMVSA